jgi:hypothetical protein
VQKEIIPDIEELSIEKEQDKIKSDENFLIKSGIFNKNSEFFTYKKKFTNGNCITFINKYI